MSIKIKLLLVLLLLLLLLIYSHFSASASWETFTCPRLGSERGRKFMLPLRSRSMPQKFAHSMTHL